MIGAEQEADKVLDEATDHDVAFLVVGDPFGYELLMSLCKRCHANSIHAGGIRINTASMLTLRSCRATTHTDLQIRARQKGIEVSVIHNASIMNAVGACGLQLYRYGEASDCLYGDLLTRTVGTRGHFDLTCVHHD